MAKLRVGYWNIRGSFQPIRLLLAYLGVAHDERRYEWRPNAKNDDWDRSDWLAERNKLGLDFPNLPWMKDPETGVRLSHHDPIMRYVAEKYAPQLLGRSLQERALVNQLCVVLTELRTTVTKHAYVGSPETNQKNKATLTATLRNFGAILLQSKRGEWLAGDQITVADFLFYEVFDIGRVMTADAFDTIAELQRVTAFLEAFEALPTIRKYLDSDECIKRPIFGVRANFR